MCKLYITMSNTTNLTQMFAVIGDHVHWIKQYQSSFFIDSSRNQTLEEARKVFIDDQISKFCDSDFHRDLKAFIRKSAQCDEKNQSKRTYRRPPVHSVFQQFSTEEGLFESLEYITFNKQMLPNDIKEHLLALSTQKESRSRDAKSKRQMPDLSI
ncbi:MAG: hypothetical protein GY861_26245 [bacterium]|nr:hypothetical protein [bacterium]